MTNVMPDASNMTVTTSLLSCDNTTLDLNRTVNNLYDLYRNSLSNLTTNVSIINFNCTKGIENYFQHLIIFQQTISIRIQITFASIYSDYINANNYQLNGFIINQQRLFNFSSITTNNSATSDACSCANIARNPLCSMNVTYPICTVLTNPWNFTCSSNLVTTTINSMPSGLNNVQLGLICGFSVFFVFLLICLSGYFYRRHTHSKQLALSRENLYDGTNLRRKTGIPQGQAFQRVKTILQPRRSTNTGISWIHHYTSTNIACDNESYMNIQPLQHYNHGAFVDRMKMNRSSFSSNLSRNVIVPTQILIHPPNHSESKIISPHTTSQSFLRSSIPLANGSSDDKLNESDSISLDQSMLNNSRLPLTHEFTNTLFTDENLRDEDAWMSILDVVNAELAILDEQERIRILL